MFEGDLWVIASDAVQMAQNAYKNGQADEREAMVEEASKKGWAMRNEDAFEDSVREIAAIRARGQA
jgi:hypothetical protein